MKKDTIKSLTTRDQCRVKISVWYGSADNYLHGFREVMANSCDEINNNFDKGIIEVELFEDLKTISVKDTGRGIPIEGKTDGKPNRVLLFETLFSGTNYDNEENGKITTGTNGVGTCVLNHTSTLFKVESYRGKKLHELIYENGGEFKSFKSYDNPLINEEYTTGTKITFKLDDDVYTKTEYVYDEVIDICDKIASVNPNIKFVIKHKDDIRNISYKSLQDYFINTMGNERSFESIVKVFDKPEKNIYEIVLTGSLENNKQYTFLNGTYLPEQGSIYDGIINGIRLYSNNYFKSNNMYKSKEKNLTNKDVQGAVSFICKVESVNVSFSNQTKFSTAKKLYEELGKEYIQEMLEIWKNEEPMEFKRLMDIILVSKRSNEKVQDYMSKTKKKLQETITVENRVDGYVDCKEYGEDSMLFVCEGRSALGSIVLARDAKNQAVFPLRGKILNILKSPYDKIFKNKEIEGLVKVLGCGVESKTTKIDFDKLRFGKLVIATDADCFTGDTKVKMLDGTCKTFEELVEMEKENPNQIYWVYSCDENGKVVPGKGVRPRITTYKDKIYHVELDNGDIIKCTDNHRFMLRDGSYKEAQYLVEGDSLMPLYSKKEIYGKRSSNLYERVKTNDNQTWEYTHRLVAKETQGGIPKGYHVHHIDKNSLNNEPNNLQILTQLEHHKIHLHEDNNRGLQHTYNGTEKHINAVKNAWKSGRYESVKQRLIEYNKTEMNRESTAILNRREDVKLLQKRGKIAKFGRKILDLGYELTEEVINTKEYKNHEEWGTQTYIFPHGTKECKKPGFSLKKILECFDGFDEFVECSKTYNHKVKSVTIEYLDEKIPMYDITVEEHHNFSLELSDGSGIFVHNCDGFHIQCLVLTMIYRLMPTLLERGHVYILDTPLFEIRDLKEDKMYYAYSDKEKDEIISKLNKYQVSRNKGLGELEPTTMSMCIKEGSNTIRQVQWEEIEEVNKWFETLMGEDLQTRKEYIKDNLHKYKMED